MIEAYIQPVRAAMQELAREASPEQIALVPELRFYLPKEEVVTDY